MQEYNPESVLNLPEGMLGFSRLRRYVLLEEQGIQPFRWLQCLDDPDLAFPVVDPHVFVKDYSFSIPAAELEKLEIHKRDEMLALVVAIIPEDPVKASVNLKAPLIINHRKMTGRQIILTESNYDVHAPVIQQKAAI